MKVASICHMFPNRVQPHVGVFVKERLKHVAEKTDLTMIAPVPSFPFMERLEKYRGLKGLEEAEMLEGLLVHHPRYFVIPRYLKWMDARFYGYSMASYIERLTRSHDFDIFDFHWVYPDGIGGLAWARRLGKKTVVTVRGNEAIYFFDDCPMRRIVQKHLKEFDHVISVSNDLKNKVVDEYGVDPSRVTVISNGIDCGKFHPLDREGARRACGVGSGEHAVLTVSRLSGEKGLDHLLKAIARLDDASLTLTIAGDGPLRPMLTALAERLGIAGRVRFLGNLDHAGLCSWYNAADIFCLPSLWEGCPNVVIEALACGTPVVASRVGGIPDLVPEPECGVLVTPGDEVALAAGLEEALRTRWNRSAISRHGSSNSWSEVADRVIGVFERVVS
ncbi:glycosyltransferase [Geomonas sp. Red32]|uniref:glycosyltransferase n=1 Tax=Geomonas sp. Red32 TaxID=2912856 RepID=UPI00202CA9F8|nr:glycosyltransferase [Geomonas sp. Red32]MCM0083372.1 glycosyltransferase [Geomonas sp. Red32]